MKNLLHLFLLGILFSCAGSGENEEVNPEDPDGKPKEFTVSLGMAGEILDMGEMPLAKSSTKGLYGVQISKFEGATYVPYAFGLFDDLSKMNVKLIDSYKYTIEVTMIPSYMEMTYGSIGSPFLSSLGNNKVDNIFYITSENSLGSLSKGTTTISGGLYNRPNVDRYYGVLSGFTPKKDELISIEMKRMVFGIKVVVGDVGEGSIVLKLNGAPELTAGYNYNPTIELQDVFTFSDLRIASESEAIEVSVIWNKRDGSSVPLIKQEIVFHRKKITVITIQIKNTSSNNSLNITQESGDLVEGDLIVLEPEIGK